MGRQREEEMRDTNESTNSRVLYFSLSWPPGRFCTSGSFSSQKSLSSNRCLWTRCYYIRFSSVTYLDFLSLDIPFSLENLKLIWFCLLSCVWLIVSIELYKRLHALMYFSPLINTSSEVK